LITTEWLNQPTDVLRCGNKYFLSLLQSPGDNRLWLLFRKHCTQTFSYFV